MNVELPSLKSVETSSSILQSKESGFVELAGELYYEIRDVDDMPTFLMNIVSGSNHWMFVASNGSLTAGRKDADNALFPYMTQDKLFDLAHTVGSASHLWVERADLGGKVLWEPFGGERSSSSIHRHLYKNVDGNKVVFEERNEVLGLVFRYTWTTGDRLGFIKHAELINLKQSSVTIRLLDGIQNLVPFGIDQEFVNKFSNLADAYKKNELIKDRGLGIYYLSSIPTDRAEPSEGLRATVAWSAGLHRKSVLVSSNQVDSFRRGDRICSEVETRGVRCAYFVESVVNLGSDEAVDWWLVADINKDAAAVEELRVKLKEADSLVDLLREDVLVNDSLLKRKVSLSDGDQLTSDRLRDARHRSNTLFNIMRGGIFDDGYTVDVNDFGKYLNTWNQSIFRSYEKGLNTLTNEIDYQGLVAWAKSIGDVDLIRLTTEYLPLSFSRRHGDPSRPWNRFSIETKDDHGNAILSYQGNWRDIFQNWEPLAYSFPGFLVGMISRFLNSSTADGYNPYRITRDGFDWEILEPNEPWSNIGYWGDHQIVYLLKLLEALEKHSPETLKELLGDESFVYAHVPYRIRGFDDIWENPRDTVDFDDEAAAATAKRTGRLGADGKLLLNKSGATVRANMLEKLLVPLFAKMSNFVLDGGIWMNTQRPEWNDANNALVGNGVSVVTLCYINRYLDFLELQLAKLPSDALVEVDASLADFMEEQVEVFDRHENSLQGPVCGVERFEMLKELGKAGESFRNNVYESNFGSYKRSVSIGRLRIYLGKALLFVGHTIDSNRRPDGMYHAYNLLTPKGDGNVELERLSEMLEGQVAVLSSNRLSVSAALDLLDSLRNSRLYRQDVRSYLLYPDRELPTFLAKNYVSKARVEQSSLLVRMLEVGDERLIKEDVSGNYRFHGDFRNSSNVADVLRSVNSDYSELMSEAEIGAVLALFEDSFNHRSFTGRSGTFFAYEGLGSVYWHMVSKLVLSIQDTYCRGEVEKVDTNLIARIEDHYFEILGGLGFDKTPQEYGAFPIDAYSHTPKHAGAQQPGMTGQVKEDILIRWGELGVNVNGGRLTFDPSLLSKSAFLQEDTDFEYVDFKGEKCAIVVPCGGLAFTYCQTLIVYSIGDEDELVLMDVDGN